MWPEPLTYPTLRWAMFTGKPTLNTWDTFTSFVLGPNQTIRVELDDLAGETGVNTNAPDELVSGESYVICAYAIGGGSATRSTYSENGEGTLTVQGTNCTFTIGYWKTHPEAWAPVTGLTLGTVFYTNAQLQQILLQPVAGNGLISLAHQLIGPAQLRARLRPLGGHPDHRSGRAQIGGLVIPPIGAGYRRLRASAPDPAARRLEHGITGPGHCGDTPATPSSWGASGPFTASTGSERAWDREFPARSSFAARPLENGDRGRQAVDHVDALGRQACHGHSQRTGSPASSSGSTTRDTVAAQRVGEVGIHRFGRRPADSGPVGDRRGCGVARAMALELPRDPAHHARPQVGEHVEAVVGALAVEHQLALAARVLEDPPRLGAGRDVVVAAARHQQRAARAAERRRRA